LFQVGRRLSLSFVMSVESSDPPGIYANCFDAS
jgi:hypothetical protein